MVPTWLIGMAIGAGVGTVAGGLIGGAMDNDPNSSWSWGGAAIGFGMGAAVGAGIGYDLRPPTYATPGQLADIGAPLNATFPDAARTAGDIAAQNARSVANAAMNNPVSPWAGRGDSWISLGGKWGEHLPYLKTPLSMTPAFVNAWEIFDDIRQTAIRLDPSTTNNIPDLNPYQVSKDIFEASSGLFTPGLKNASPLKDVWDIYNAVDEANRSDLIKRAIKTLPKK